jgi:hypothetical protein
LPDTSPAPSSITSTSTADRPAHTVTVHSPAPLWRITLVAPSRHRPGENRLDLGIQRHRRRVAIHRGLDAGRRERHLRARQLALQRGPAVAADRLAHLHERGTGHVLHLADLGRGLLRARGQQPARELGLQRDDRQAVAEQVVQVTGEALSLPGHGAPASAGRTSRSRPRR